MKLSLQTDKTHCYCNNKLKKKRDRGVFLISNNEIKKANETVFVCPNSLCNYKSFFISHINYTKDNQKFEIYDHPIKYIRAGHKFYVEKNQILSYISSLAGKNSIGNEIIRFQGISHEVFKNENEIRRVFDISLKIYCFLVMEYKFVQKVDGNCFYNQNINFSGRSFLIIYNNNRKQAIKIYSQFVYYIFQRLYVTHSCSNCCLTKDETSRMIILDGIHIGKIFHIYSVNMIYTCLHT